MLFPLIHWLCFTIALSSGDGVRRVNMYCTPSSGDARSQSCRLYVLHTTCTSSKTQRLEYVSIQCMMCSDELSCSIVLCDWPCFETSKSCFIQIGPDQRPLASSLLALYRLSSRSGAKAKIVVSGLLSAIIIFMTWQTPLLKSSKLDCSCRSIG